MPERQPLLLPSDLVYSTCQKSARLVFTHLLALYHTATMYRSYSDCDTSLCSAAPSSFGLWKRASQSQLLAQAALIFLPKSQPGDTTLERVVLRVQVASA